MSGKAAGAATGVGLGLAVAFIIGCIVTRIRDEVFIVAPLRKQLKTLEWKIYYLEKDVEELKAGYTIIHGRIEELNNKIENLENEIVELWNATEGMTEIRKRLQNIYARLVDIKKRK